MKIGKHRIVVESTSRGPRCAKCHVPLLRDGRGYYHSPNRIYRPAAAPTPTERDEPRDEPEFLERSCPACGAALAPADMHWNLATDAYECPARPVPTPEEKTHEDWVAHSEAEERRSLTSPAEASE